MYELFENDSEEETEEDWFFDSFVRYKQLLMFTLDDVVTEIQASSPHAVCVAVKHGSQRVEILELALPHKLLSAPSQHCLTNNNDFKVRNGGFVDSCVIQMKSLYNREKLVTSEGGAEVHVYQLGGETSALVTKISSIRTSVEAALLAVNSQGHVLASSTVQDGLHLLDISMGTVILSAPLGMSRGCVCPVFTSHNMGGVCFTDSGLVRLRDLRHQGAWTSIGKDVGCSEERWTVTSVYQSSIHAQDECHTSTDYQAKLALLSAKGRLQLYDMRNTSSAVFDVCLARDEGAIRKADVSFSPGGTLLSVCGLDGNVHVYDCLSLADTVPVFTHEGHVKQKTGKKGLYVSSHMWLRRDVVMSAASDGSLHCWQF